MKAERQLSIKYTVYESLEELPKAKKGVLPLF